MKRLTRGETAKSINAGISNRLNRFGLLRGFAAHIGRQDIEQKYNEEIIALLRAVKND